VVHFGERDPSGVTLARDVGLTGFALRVERVELLLEPIVGTPNFGRSGFRMFALRALDGAACALPQTEETGTRPMGFAYRRRTARCRPAGIRHPPSSLLGPRGRWLRRVVPSPGFVPFPFPGRFHLRLTVFVSPGTPAPRGVAPGLVGGHAIRAGPSAFSRPGPRDPGPPA